MFLGSSRIQFASSLLIVSSEPSVAFTATASSSEPSTLKSPTAEFGSRDASGLAAFSKTRATVSRISVGLGGADGLLARAGVGVGEAIESTRAAGSIVAATRGAGSTLLASWFLLVQPGTKIALTSKATLKPKTFVLLQNTGKPSLPVCRTKDFCARTNEGKASEAEPQTESSFTDHFGLEPQPIISN